MHLRFAVGEVPEEHREDIAEEEAKFGSFLHIPLAVNFLGLSGPMPLLRLGLTCTQLVRACHCTAALPPISWEVTRYLLCL